MKAVKLKVVKRFSFSKRRLIHEGKYIINMKQNRVMYNIKFLSRNCGNVLTEGDTLKCPRRFNFTWHQAGGEYTESHGTNRRW